MLYSCTGSNTEGLLAAQYGYVYIAIEDTAVARVGIPQHLKKQLGTGGLFSIAWKHVSQEGSHFWKVMRNSEKD